MTLLDLSCYLGQIAAGAVAANLLLGMLMSLRYSPVRHWPHRHIDIFALHRWTAYIAIFFTLTHPAALLLLHTPHFGVFDVLLPIHSYLQPTINTIGAAALYLVVLVLVSSLLNPARPPAVAQPALSRLSRGGADVRARHSYRPDLKDGHPDLLDGGKVYLEIAALLCLAAIAIRIRLRGRGLRSMT